MYLLYISKNNLEVFKNHQKVGEVSWTPENLSQNLSRLKTNFSSYFRVLLADDFITVTSLLLTPHESKKRSIIQSKFQPIISENLSQTVWDYKIVAHQNGKRLIQLIFVSQKFFDQFRTAVKSSRLKINLLESFSTSISRYLPPKKLVFLSYQNLLILSFNQTPIFSQVLSKKITQEDIDRIFDYSKQRFQTLPQQILFSPIGDVAFNQFNFGNLLPEYTSIDPLKGIIHSTNIHGSDSSTSKLEIKSDSNISFFSKIILIIPLLLLILGFFVIFGSKITSDKTPEISPTISVPTPITTPTSVPVEDLKIQVLNGSGTAGEASKIVDLVSQYKFKVENTSNAANFDFTQTQIQTKKSVSSYAINLLIESLGKKYTAKLLPENLSSSSEFDVIITTGK
jgi:hypothetical protein